MKKKLLLVLMCLVMTMQCITLPASAATSNSEKYDILCSLGFFKEGTQYNPAASVTRIELLNALFSAIPEDKQTPCSDDTGFADVKTTDDIANVAYNTYLRGLLGGDKKLYPYNQIGVEDASEILVNLLGYGAAITSKGYSAIASDIGLTKNMPKTSGFTMENLVCMFFNALDVEVVTPLIMTDSNGLQDGKTFLTEILLAGKGTGVVHADAYTSILGYDGVSDGEVRIGKDIYALDNATAGSLLGCKIDYYYKLHENDIGKIIYTKINSSVKITEFEAENIVSFRDLTYKYEYGPTLNKTKSISFDTGAAVVYNGIQIVAPFDSYQPKYGSVKLISNDGSKNIDAVIITDYSVVVVDAFNLDNAIIYDKYDTDNVIELDNESSPASYTVTLPDGSPAKFTDAAEYDVMFVAISQNGEKTSIVLSKDTVSGSVSAYSSTTIKINGVVYEVADKNFLANESVKSGLSGVFHLDPNGRVASFEKQQATGLKCGYMTKIVLLPGDENDMEYDVLKITFFSQDGDMKILYTGKKPYLDDVKVDEASVIYNEFTTLNTAGKYEVVPQIFLYKLNNKGEIKYLYKARAYDNNDLTNKEGFCEINSAKEWLVVNQDKQLQMNFRFDDETIILAVPKDVKNEDGFEVFSGASSPFGWRKHAYFRAYAMESNAAVADYMVWYRGESGSSDGTTLAIDSISETIDEEDAVVKKMIGINSAGTQVEYAFASSLTDGAATLESGDIIRGVIDEYNVISDFTQVFDYGTQTQLVTTSSDPRSDPRYGFWNVYSVDGTDVMMTKKSPSDTLQRSDMSKMFLTNKVVWKYNSKKRRFEKCDMRDINGFSTRTDYHKIFTITTYGDYSFCAFYD